MTHHKSVKRLSKGVLDLKFMKKTKEKTAIEVENEERQFLYQDQLAALNTKNKFVRVASAYDVGTYLPCRMSFGGFEADIEKINNQKLTGLYEVLRTPDKAEAEEEADVTKAEMASHFANLNETLAKKFGKRPKHQSFRPKKMRKSGEFKKPND